MFETFWFAIFYFLIVTVLVLSGTSWLCAQLWGILNGGKKTLAMKQQRQQGVFKQAPVNSDGNKPHKTSTDLAETEIEVDWAECRILPLQPFAGLKEDVDSALMMSCPRMQILWVIYFQRSYFCLEGRLDM